MEQLGAANLALGHCQLVAEDDELDVLRSLRAEFEDGELEQAAERPAEEL